MNTFVVDLGHFQVKSGVVANKSTNRGSRGANATAAAKAKKQPVVSFSPTTCLDSVNGMLDANLAQHQIGSLMEHGPTPSSGGGEVSTSAVASADKGSSMKVVSSLDPRETTLVLTVDVSTPRRIKEALVAAVFEKLEVAHCHLGHSSVNALYATGGTTGMVIDMGHFSSRVVPVQDGQPLREHIHTTQLGGYAQSMHLQTLLSKTHQQFGSGGGGGQGDILPLLDQQVLHRLKEVKGRAHPKGRQSTAGGTGTTSAVMAVGGASTQAAGGSSDTMASFSLPDGSAVSVAMSSEQGYELGDVLLNPQPLVNSFFAMGGGTVFGANKLFPHYNLLAGEVGVDAVAINCLENLRPMAPQCCESYLLCGGPSLMTGVNDAVKHSISQAMAAATTSAVGPGTVQKMTPMSIALEDRGLLRQPKQRVASDRVSCSWQGTTLLAQLSSFSAFKVSRKTYNEEGPSGVLPLFHTDQL